MSSPIFLIILYIFQKYKSYLAYVQILHMFVKINRSQQPFIAQCVSTMLIFVFIMLLTQVKNRKYNNPSRSCLKYCTSGFIQQTLIKCNLSAGETTIQ